MNFHFKNKRISALRAKRIGKYIIYAIGEVSLIIIGILLAVYINKKSSDSKDSVTRCIYQSELLYALEKDTLDISGNIMALKAWNPMIIDLYYGLQNDSLENIDSLNLKFGTVGNFIFFGQSSKSKIEEIKYSSINLINDRDLKNKVLVYQDEKIAFISVIQVRYNTLDEDIRQYYSHNFRGYNYFPAYPIAINKIKNDNYYQSLVYQKINMNALLLMNYTELLKNQKEIIEALKLKTALDCK